MDIETYQGHGLHLIFNDEYPNKTVNGRANSEILDALNTSGDVHYHPCPEAYPGEETPTGNLQRFKKEQYNINRNEDLILFFGDFEEYLTEDEMWNLSETIKPRGSGNKAK